MKISLVSVSSQHLLRREIKLQLLSNGITVKNNGAWTEKHEPDFESFFDDIQRNIWKGLIIAPYNWMNLHERYNIHTNEIKVVKMDELLIPQVKDFLNSSHKLLYYK